MPETTTPCGLAAKPRDLSDTTSEPACPAGGALWHDWCAGAAVAVVALLYLLCPVLA